MSEDTETNPLRAMMVANIIAQNPGEPITVESLAKLLPGNFDLGEDDLEHYRQSRPVTFEGEPEAPEQDRFDRMGEQVDPATYEPRPLPDGLKNPPPIAASAEPEAPPPATPEAIDAAVHRRIMADQGIANARVAVTVAGNIERAARTKLAEAVTEFQNGFPKVTRETLMRDYVASEQARKAAGHPLQRQGRPGKSEVDQSAFYSRGGNPARHFPPPWSLNGKLVPPGTPGAVEGSKGYRRGALPSQARGAPNFNPARGNVVAQPKVPSER